MTFFNQEEPEIKEPETPVESPEGKDKDEDEEV